MGQQQLFIITLVIFIVGASVYAGSRMVESYNQSNDREVVIQQMKIIFSEAKKYVTQPRSVGGGEGSFEDFVAPKSLSNTQQVTIHTTTGRNWILFQGFGTVIGDDRKAPVQVIGQYDNSNGEWTFVNVN